MERLALQKDDFHPGENLIVLDICNAEVFQINIFEIIFPMKYI